MPKLRRVEPKKWKVQLKDMQMASLELNEQGMKLSVTDKVHLGDLCLSSTGVTWHAAREGKPSKTFRWDNLIKLLEGHRQGKIE